MTGGEIIAVVGILIMLVGGSFLVIMWAREESATLNEPPFFERARPGPYRVVLESVGRRKSSVMRLVRQARRECSLAEALRAVNHPPAILVEGISHPDAEWLVTALAEKGATARIEPIETTFKQV